MTSQKARQFLLGRLRQAQTWSQRSGCAGGAGVDSAHDTDAAPVVEEIVLFYNLVFDLGGPLDPTATMRRLLDEDIAVAGANPLTGEVELATRFRTLQRQQRKAQLLSELAERLQSGSVRGLGRWMLRHPSLIVRLRLRRARRSGRSAQKEDDQTGNEPPELAAVLSETTALIEEAMRKVQGWEQLQFHSDQCVFSPIYLAHAPFTRVALQSCRATVEGHDLTADVDVLLHRAGVGILRFGVHLAEPMSVDHMIALQTSARAQVTRWEVARQLVETDAAAFGMSIKTLLRGQTNFREEFSEGITWLIDDQAEGRTILDLLKLYRTTIVSVICGKPPRPDRRNPWLRTDDWLSYPILFVRRTSPQPATATSFKAQYGRALAGLAVRAPNWRDIKEAVIADWIRDDHAQTDNESFYINSGMAAIVYHGAYHERLSNEFGVAVPGQQWLSAHFQRSVVVEAFLVQRWILHTLRSQLSVLPSNPRRLDALKRDLALALEEYHAVTFSYGSANDIVKRAHTASDIDDDYAAVRAGVTNVETLVEAEQASARHRRNVSLGMATLVATMLLGLAGAHQVTVVLAGWSKMPQDRWPNWIVAPANALLTFAGAHPAGLTLMIYAALVIAIIAILVVPWWNWRLRRRNQPIISLDRSRTAARPGFTWPIKQDRSASSGESSQ